MKNIIRFCVAIVLLVSVAAIARAQDDAEASEVFLSAEIGVFAFPMEDQSAEQQATDEQECYEWAHRHTGIDPVDLLVEAEAVEQETSAAKKEASKKGKGKEGSSALIGALAGALIAEVRDDDWEEGAAWGAAAGARSGRRDKDRERSAARSHVEGEAREEFGELEEELGDFQKAFSACLEAKSYNVKY